MSRIVRGSWMLFFAVTLAACGDHADGPAEPAGRARTLPIPAGEAEPPAPAGLAAPPTGSGTGTQALRWQAPAAWISEPPGSPMRRAQYRIPGAEAGDGECTVFYFGPGQGGDPMSNAARWAGQFTRPDGTPARDDLKTRTYQVGAITVLEVEITGTYDGGMTMNAAPPAPRPGSMLLGAIAEGPDANWFFKLTGPEATVRAERAGFEAMLQSLQPGN